MTCWRRVRDCQQAGVWDLIHFALLGWLPRDDQIDWSRAVVERTFAWLSQFRRLRVRYDKRADIHEAFLSLGCAVICWQSLRKTWRTA
jgi:transposase